MAVTDFSHLIFWQHPLSSLCFFAFAMSFISLWVRKTPWIWGSFLVIAYILAFQAGIATSLSLIPVGLLFCCHWMMKNEIKTWGRLFLFALATVISLALSFHILPGFHNWQLTGNLTLGSGAYPYSLWLSFDRPFIGLFPLIFSIPLIQSRAQLRRVALMTIPMAILGSLLMLWVSLNMGMVKWDPKIPTILVAWAIDNLIFVSIPEEAFFRGFFQKEIRTWLGSGSWARVGAVFATSLFFVLIHVKWVPSIPFLFLVFLAGIIYGTIYEITQSIESSIFCHFMLNLTHLLLFTYPALQGSII